MKEYTGNIEVEPTCPQCGGFPTAYGEMKTADDAPLIIYRRCVCGWQGKFIRLYTAMLFKTVVNSRILNDTVEKGAPE